ncbi:AraC family transcriptional regulator [Streptomyces sp. M19]
MPVSRIAAEVGWSQSYLVRRFTQQIGLSPKSAARVLRFHRAVGLLTGQNTNPAAVAAACGFYDQAHLNREFRALAETTPARWPPPAGRRGADPVTGAPARQVRFFQDGRMGRY